VEVFLAMHSTIVSESVSFDGKKGSRICRDSCVACAALDNRSIPTTHARLCGLSGIKLHSKDTSGSFVQSASKVLLAYGLNNLSRGITAEKPMRNVFFCNASHAELFSGSRGPVKGGVAQRSRPEGMRALASTLDGVAGGKIIYRGKCYRLRDDSKQHNKIAWLWSEALTEFGKFMPVHRYP
jgi:hypothetical protein